MKKSFYFLVFLITGTYSFSQDIEKLPLKPWDDILEMNSQKYRPITKWSKDILVGLEGKYSKTDSITIAKALKKLDALTETISIKFSKSEKPNFRIKFLDIPVKQGNNSYVNVRYGAQSSGEGYGSAELYIYKIDGTDTDLNINTSLESRIAKALVDGSFVYPAVEVKRNSIFNPIYGQSNNNLPLNEDDIAIIKEVYKTGFEKRLAKATKQFKNIINKLKEDKVLRRDKSIWWVKNPDAVLILPTIILLLLFIFLVKKTNQLIAPHIKKDWIRFGILALIALFFSDILIVLYSYSYDFLTTSVIDFRSISYINNSQRVTVILIALFPFIFLLRFIENLIRKSAQQIFAKTMLIFISTVFLPFVCFALFLFFINGINTDNYYDQLSQVFLYLMIIGSIRAFVSYFIFKERSLIVENEMKLSTLRELKVQAELKSLQSQINPHFLYNSLNSIASLAPIDAQKTQEMAHSLSDLFKYSINRKDKKMSTIFEEVEMVKTYLDIEKIRFGDRLQFNVLIDKELENNEIPLFLIQPLVENAVKHGISQNEGEGIIILKISKEQNEIRISVSDNGPNFPEGLVSGHGLQTVFDLLRLTYGDKATLNWTNTPQKMIIITIPETL